MGGFLILEDDEYEQIFNAINERQLVFHPKYSPNGCFDSKDFVELKRQTNILVLDRNIMSALMQYAQKGRLKNNTDMNDIALTMLWITFTNASFSYGFAISEYFDHQNDQDIVSRQLDLALFITENYPLMIWKHVLYSEDKTIPIVLETKKYNRDIQTNKEQKHLLCKVSNFALARIYKSNKSNKDKLIEFINWSYDNTWISKHLLIYSILLFGQYEGVKAPKNINSKDINKVIQGCINQAADLSYLDDCHWLNINMKQENYFFTTFDRMLKLLAIATNEIDAGNYDPINELFNKKDAYEICEVIKRRQENRAKPDISDEAVMELFEREKNLLCEAINSIKQKSEVN